MQLVGWLLLGIGLFITGFFVLNLYFRIKVVRSYRNLSRNGVQFAGSAIFSPSKMQEIINRYPDHEDDLLKFSKYLRMSIWMASVFIVTIIIFGSVLMYFR